MRTPSHPVTWFEHPAADLDRAQRFYEAVLGVELAFNEMGPLKMAWFRRQDSKGNRVGLHTPA